MARERLLATVNARLDRFVEGHTEELMSSDAAADARALAAYGDELDVAYALALFHHYRVVAGVREEHEALRFFDTVYRQAPDLVPDGLRDHVGDSWRPNPADVDAWRLRAQDLLRHPGRFGQPALFLDASLLLRLVLDRGKLSPPERAGVLSGLVIAHVGRFETTGESNALDEAVACAEQCVAATAPDDPNAAGRRSNLASALASRFDHAGTVDDLERSISELWQAVETAAHDERPSYLTNLGGALRLRFLHTGDLASLTAAVDCGRWAVAEAPPTDPGRPRMLAVLALALRTRHQRLDRPEDLDEAVVALQTAVDLTSPTAPDHAGHRSALGTALRVRFGMSEAPADIDGAVENCGAAATLATADPGRKARFLSNLGAALSARYRFRADPADLHASAATQTEAAGLVDPDHPLRATVLANLGLSLHQRAALGAADAGRDLRASAAAYAESGAVVQAAALVRATSWYEAGLGWAQCTDWAAARDAFSQAVDLIAGVVDHRLDRDDRQYHLHRLSGLGSEAAAAALRAGEDPRTALNLLENARGVLLAQMRSNKADLAALRIRFPELAERFVHLSSAVDRGDHAGPTSGARLRHRRQLERDRMLAEIRTLPGFGQSLQPVTEPVSLHLPGPAAVINVARSGCDGLIVHDGTVTRVNLGGLSYEDARAQANILLEAVHDESWTSNDRIGAVLTWLWTSIAQPILRTLDRLGLVDHLWWIPTGPLTVMPLHAAQDPSLASASVIDRVTSSYAPTVRALSRVARSTEADNLRDGPTSAAPLVVAIPAARGHRAIPAAAKEAADVVRRLEATGHSRVATLVGPAATRAAVLARLANCRWAHFACHAATTANPADSHLVLNDESLPVRDIAELDIHNAHLAYLSACTTAFSGTDLVDESIHISSAFQLAGFQHVIGTLWRVDDEVARLAAQEIYDDLVKSAPGAAVHQATRRLRARYPENPRIWAGFVHVGA